MGAPVPPPLRVLVVDDEPLARARLRALLQDCTQPPVQVVGEAANAPQAQALLQHPGADLVLLDIHLPGASGLQLARLWQDDPAARPPGTAPAVVFVTADPAPALEAFALDAVDYLTKPVRLERLHQALQKAERFRQSRQGLEADLTHDAGGNWLLIEARGRQQRVPLAEVLYLKAELKYLTVRTAHGQHLLDASLSDLEARHGARFVRVHRNALVARHALRALERSHDPVEGEGWAVRLHGVDEALAVSRRQLAAVRAALAGSG